MSINLVSKTGINNGRRDIPISTPLPLDNQVTIPWIRPIDWLTLPTISPTEDKLAGLVAIHDTSSNYLAMTIGTTGTTFGGIGFISDGTGPAGQGAAGNIYSGTSFANFVVGQYLSATGITAGTYITDINLATFTGSFSGTTLTITNVTSGTISLGMVITGLSNLNGVYIKAFGTGTGDTGTYIISASTVGTPTAGRSYIVSISQLTASTTNISGYAPITIDWGDGTTETVPGFGIQQHRYNYNDINISTLSTLGYKQVIVTATSADPTVGIINSYSFIVQYVNSPTLPLYYNKWLDMRISGPGLTSLLLGSASATTPCGYLEQFELLSTGTNFSSASTFANCFKLQSIPTYNLSNITSLSYDMNSMFNNCTGLVVVPSSIDFSNMNSLFQMFSGCTNLAIVPELNTPKVTSTRFMFNNCGQLRSIPNFDCSKVTSAQAMFQNCNSLTTIPPLNFSSLLITTSTMFSNCTSLKVAPYFNTENVTACDSMFNSCYALNTLPAYNLQKVTTTASMFQYCYGLSECPDFNLPKVTTMFNMFSACNSLINAPTLQTSNLLTIVNAMFSGCQSLISVPLFNTESVTTFNSTFSDCRALRNIPLFNTSKAIDLSLMFGTCQSLESIPLLDTSNVTIMNSMFSTCKLLQTIPLLDMTKVTTCTGMFLSCTSLNEVPLLNTSNVTNMASMFQFASSLKKVPLLNTEKVANMTLMFNQCTTLESIPLLNTNKVTAMNGLFQNCTSLVNIPILDTSNVTTIASTFTSCTSLVNIPAWDMSKLTAAVGTISGNNISRIQFTGSKVQIAITNCGLQKEALEELFTNVSANTITSQTLTITNNPGADPIITSGTLVAGQAIGSTTLTVSNSAAYKVGMYLVGSNPVFPSISVTLQTGVNTVTYTNHGFLTDTMVAWSAVPPSATPLTINTIYYVINPTANTFQVALTKGGAPVAIGANINSGCVLRYETIIVDVPTSTTIVVSVPTKVVSTAAVVNARYLNTNIASFKYYNVTG